MLHEYSPNFARIFTKFCKNIHQILQEYSLNVARILTKCCTNIHTKAAKELDKQTFIATFIMEELPCIECFDISVTFAGNFQGKISFETGKCNLE